MTSPRKYIGIFIVLAFAALAVALIGVTRTGYAQSSPTSKIAPWVLEHTANNQSAEFLVVLTEQADLSAAAQLPDKASKGNYVYNTLYQTAQSTQAPLLAWLTARGIEHRAYYIVNLIWVKGDRDTALALAARSDVARIDGNPTIRVIPDRPLGPINPGAPTGIEPNITYVHAPQVWSMGFTGQGVVVGGQDTGIQWDHPALKNHYRGWNGTTASHDYNWHDSIHSGGGVCGANSPFPCDDDQHGTHTMGTVLGDDGGANQIGMAPGAKFIGCRNMNVGAGTPATYLECFEFFLAPYPVGGTPGQGDPTKAPDVTNNSWGCPTSEGCNITSLLAAVQAQRAAGIMTVVSAGNSGSSCNTVTDPPSFYDEVYTVGALNTGTDGIASFSSRGAVTADGSNRRKPDISAPGTNIRSSIPGSSYQGGWDGTSMAGPHVAGAVALLWSARPALKNNIDLTEQAINDSAVHINNATCDPVGTTWPNNTYGYGRLDIKAAVDLQPSNNGTLIGAVTNINTAAPIAGAKVTVWVGASQITNTTTLVNGQYALVLSPNTYTVTASAYGYQPAQLTGISVMSTTTTTQNIVLSPASFYSVSGTVRNVQTGQPLTSTITIAGAPVGQVQTDPASGYYTISLAEGGVYTFTVTSSGYVTATKTVGPLITNRTENFALNADLLACTAPGYQFNGLRETFDATVIPTGWATINHTGTVGWSFDNPKARANLTGGTGNFAIADSDAAGKGNSMDTELRTPVLDFSGLTSVTLTFKTDFRFLAGSLDEVANVDVSLNGAAGPWNTVWHKTADYRGPKTEMLDLTALAGQANVMLRFHYYNAVWEWWWQVDDVQLGQCRPQSAVNLPALTPATAAQAGYPGTVVTYTLNLSNTDSVSHTFDVLIDHNSWPTVAVTPIGPVAAHSSQPVTVTVAIPLNAGAGTTDVAQVIAGTGALSATAGLTTTANALPRLTLDPATATQSGDPGITVTYTLNVSNTSDSAQTFDVAINNNSWPTVAVTPIGPVAAHNALPFTITVTVPAATLAYQTDTAQIVVSAPSGLILSGTAILTTAANFVPGLELDPTQAAQTGSAGEAVTYTLHLTNTGNFTDTFALDYAGSLWDVHGAISATLAAGSGTPLLVTIQVPPTATTGLSDTVRFTATGTGVTAFSDFTTTAEHWYGVFLPLILND